MQYYAYYAGWQPPSTTPGPAPASASPGGGPAVAELELYNDCTKLSLPTAGTALGVGSAGGQMSKGLRAWCVCMHVWVCGCVHVWVCVRVRVWLCACMLCVGMYMSACMCVWLCVLV